MIIRHETDFQISASDPSGVVHVVNPFGRHGPVVGTLPPVAKVSDGHEICAVLIDETQPALLRTDSDYGDQIIDVAATGQIELTHMGQTAILVADPENGFWYVF